MRKTIQIKAPNHNFRPDASDARDQRSARRAAAPLESVDGPAQNIRMAYPKYPYGCPLDQCRSLLEPVDKPSQNIGMVFGVDTGVI